MDNKVDEFAKYCIENNVKLSKLLGCFSGLAAVLGVREEISPHQMKDFLQLILKSYALDANKRWKKHEVD